MRTTNTVHEKFNYEGHANDLRMAYAAGKQECTERRWHAEAHDDYANAAIATAVEQDRDDRLTDAAANAQEGRYEAWIAIEGDHP